MNNNDRHIVAIDLGSSKISLTVAKVNGQDVQVIYYKETPSNGVRYSCIYNDRNTRKSLENAIKAAEAELDIKITQAIAGMPKYPITQESGNASFPDRNEEEISEEEISRLKKFAQAAYLFETDSKETIYGSVAQSFSDGENFQIIEEDIIGMCSDTLEGNFKIFIGKKNNLAKIDAALNATGVAPARKYFTAESTAKAVLKESEMEGGVALVDFGGGSTSVSIYQGKIMRHYASIPFGGKNITNDIKNECQISEHLAENIKLEFGACMPDKLLNLSDKILDIKVGESSKQLSVKYLSEIITARVEEIMMAILYEIENSGFADSLRCGIVVTGGSAQIPNLASLIHDISGYKTRIGYPSRIFSCEGCEGLAETTAATSIGLIISSMNDQSINCVVPNEPAAESTESDSGEANSKTDNEHTGVIGTAENPQGELFEKDQTEVAEASKPKEKSKKEGRKRRGIISIFKGGFNNRIDSIFEFLDDDDTPQPIVENEDNEEEETEEKA